MQATDAQEGSVTGGSPSDRGVRPVLIFAVLALVLALRLMHFSSALHSPVSYQPGPDEEYYLRLGQAVAGGAGMDVAASTFMDPGYGYLLGGIFRLTGANPVLIYLLQAILDTATALGILLIGRMLGRPRAGLWGALLYGITATAIMFCATLLKETSVAAYLTWWVVSALAVQRIDRRPAWVAFGVLCGCGLALRSTLALLVPVAVLLPLLGGGTRLRRASRVALVLGGFALSLVPWSLRNHRDDGSWSPLPHNGGIVLHQAYNVDNPASAIWIPPFVNYSSPGDIWRGYAAEAQARVGHPLSPPQIDRYWRDEALGFMARHPADVLGDVVRKASMFLADSEIPNNRSSAEERLFSPVLRVLPPPAVGLLSLGFAGLLWLATSDRRWPLVATPIAIAWASFALFWAEDRFRFHAAPMLALCGGIFIDGIARNARRLRSVRPAACAALAVAIAAASLYLGGRFPPPPIRWDHIVWGYIKMGQFDEARTLAGRIAIEQPDNEPIIEARGYLAAVAHDYDEAVRDYTHALALRPRSSGAHYNLARAWLARGDKSRASAEASAAVALDPSAENRALAAQIDSTP